MEPITVHHPKTPHLSATITMVANGSFEITTGHQYSYDQADTYEEAYKVAHELMEDIYSGAYHKEMAADRRYAAQERYACGNY